MNKLKGKRWFIEWNRWRKRNTNSWLYKLLVLFKVRRSISLELQIGEMSILEYLEYGNSFIVGFDAAIKANEQHRSYTYMHDFVENSLVWKTSGNALGKATVEHTEDGILVLCSINDNKEGDSQ